MKHRISRLSVLLAAGICATLVGCEDDELSTLSDARNGEARIINDTGEPIAVVYEQGAAILNTGVAHIDRETIPAYEQRSVWMYFGDSGSGQVTVVKGSEEKTFAIQIEDPRLVVSAADFE